MKIRTALLLYGHMRSYKDCITNLKKNLIDILDPDIFIHTWDELDSTTTSWHKLNMSNTPIESDERKRIIELYQPKRIEFENQKINLNDSEQIINGMSLEGQKNMYYSFFRANEMKKQYEIKNNVSYDLVIKLRPDILLKNPFTKFLKKQNYSNDQILLCGNKVKYGKKLRSYQALDVIMASNSKSMDLTANIYNVINKYLSKDVFHHSTFIDYLLDLNIDIHISKYDYGKNWTIKRKEEKK